jgi:hypothetical protein
MKLYYSKTFIAVLILMIVLFISGFINKLPLWIAILLLVPILQFTLHEYVHVFVAWLYGVKTEYVMCNFSTLCCRFESLSANYPNRDKIYSNITFSGALFQSAIYSFEITILILSGLSLQNNMPFLFAGMLAFCYFWYDILHPQCDFRRVYNRAKQLQSQSLSRLNFKYK